MSAPIIDLDSKKQAWRRCNTTSCASAAVHESAGCRDEGCIHFDWNTAHPELWWSQLPGGNAAWIDDLSGSDSWKGDLGVTLNIDHDKQLSLADVAELRRVLGELLETAAQHGATPAR